MKFFLLCLGEKVQQAIADASGLATLPNSIYITTAAADHIVCLRIDMFARPGPMNGPQDK